MSDSLLDVLATVPSELLMVYAMTRLLAIGRPRLFWGVQVVLMVLMAATRTLLPAPVRMVYGVVANVVLPVAFSRGAPGRRVLVAVLSYVVLLVAEAFCLIPWVLMTGLPVPSDDYAVVRSHLPAFVTMHVLHLMVLAVLLGGLERLVGRVFAGPRALERSMPLYAVVPLLQVPLLFVALGLKQYLLPQVEGLFAGNAVLAVACAAADVALFWSLASLRDKVFAEQRAAVLDERLDAELASYASLAARLAQTSRLRHDFRNQAQVVLALAPDRPRDARAHVAELRLLVQAAGEQDPAGFSAASERTAP